MTNAIQESSSKETPKVANKATSRITHRMVTTRTAAKHASERKISIVVIVLVAVITACATIVAFSIAPIVDIATSVVEVSTDLCVNAIIVFDTKITRLPKARLLFGIIQNVQSKEGTIVTPYKVVPNEDMEDLCHRLVID
ncbi:17819_t:CDS:2 [Funneliformis caledonium]|uniref:17819_t:CDS:1 n=1 Tax=Funneliformis caledonium TaxID=1117310 RepID=A0A9N8WIT2_9GLOM|nr:17819_t:CDS:2 [Funneliformis caledonium]